MPRAKAKSLSNLFLYCAEEVRANRSYAICYAIMDAPFPPDVRDRAEKIIVRSLKGCMFYTGWVKEFHPEVYRAADKAGKVDVMARAGRVAWCEALAKQHKGKK